MFLFEKVRQVKQPRTVQLSVILRPGCPMIHSITELGEIRESGDRKFFILLKYPMTSIYTLMNINDCKAIGHEYKD